MNSFIQKGAVVIALMLTSWAVPASAETTHLFCDAQGNKGGVDKYEIDVDPDAHQVVALSVGSLDGGTSTWAGSKDGWLKAAPTNNTQIETSEFDDNWIRFKLVCLVAPKYYCPGNGTWAINRYTGNGDYVDDFYPNDRHHYSLSCSAQNRRF